MLNFWDQDILQNNLLNIPLPESTKKESPQVVLSD